MRTEAVAVPHRMTLRLPGVQGDALTAWGLGFGLVLYLGLRGGGYDAVVRGQIGVLAWWVLLLLAVAGLVPRLTRLGWAAVAVLAAWAAWTALGISSSESAERTLAEVGRVSTYLGILALALVAQGRAGSRHLFNGVATAMATITVLSVMSRLHPQWFPHNQQFEFLPDAVRRLSYPLNYWNAQAAFMAMAAVVLLGVAATARTRIGQALAGAVVPLAGLGVFMCLSRSGAIVIVVGLLVYLALAGDRLPKLASILVAGAGTAILIAGADQRDAMLDGLDTAAARSQGTELLWLCIIVCLGTAAMQVAVTLLGRHANRPRWLVVPRRHAAIATGVIGAVCIAVFFASSLDTKVSNRWTEFKTPPSQSRELSLDNVFSRLDNAAGQGRYQYWESAVDAYETDRWRGIGAGTFEFWWARNATVGGKIVDAHNLYVQTLAEEGLPGFALLAAFVLLTLVAGVWRTLSARNATARTLIAASTAALVIFWVVASIEWVWQIAVLPAVVMLLGAIILGGRDPQARRLALIPRGALAVAAVAASIPIALVLASTIEIRDSQAEARAGDLPGALADARTAASLQGAAATPRLQQALVLEQARDYAAAETAAQRAVDAEPTNYKLWLALSRIQAKAGHPQEALRSFRRARSLNPRSVVFAR